MAEVYLDVPPGVTFWPDDFEAIHDCLMNKAYGRPLPYNEIPEIDLYPFSPDELPKEEIASFFTYNHLKPQNSSERVRWTSKGYWKSLGADEEIEHDGEVIGYKKYLVFHWDKSADATKGNYIMAEYRLNPSLATDDSNTRKNIEDLLFCKVERRAPDVIYVPRVRLLEEDSESSEEEEEEILSAKG